MKSFFKIRPIVEENLFNKEIEDAKKLPNDPSLGQDVFSDGILNENPTIKSDILSGLYHQLGYATGSIVTIKETLKYLNMSKEDYAKHLKEQEEIVEHNKKELERVTKIIENGKKRFK